VEPRFGYDFSAVRVHTDQSAAESARALGASAYTAGTHVVFGSGHYSPASLRGKSLMAHELAHVVQQNARAVDGTEIGWGVRVSDPQDCFERRASAAAAAVGNVPAPGSPARNELTRLNPAPTTPGHGLFVQRQEEGAFTKAGTIAGIAGAALGLGALVLGILQLRAAKQSPAQPTGGLNISNVQFGPVAPAQQAQQAANPPQGGTATTETKAPVTPTMATKDILRIAASDDSQATIGLNLKTDGHQIIEAYTQEQTVIGYGGGSTGDNATLTFHQTPTSGTDPSIAEAAIPFEGINTSEEKIQRFVGRFRVRGNGEVSCENIRNVIGPTGSSADRSDTEPYATVRLKPPSTPSSAGSLERGSESPESGFDPSKLLPFNKPMAGS
jgi:hypothetical protein